MMEGQAGQMRFKQYVELLARGWEDIGIVGIRFIRHRKGPTKTCRIW